MGLIPQRQQGFLRTWVLFNHGDYARGGGNENLIMSLESSLEEHTLSFELTYP